MDRLEEIKQRVNSREAPVLLYSHAPEDFRWLLAEVERLESDVNSWRWEHSAALKRAETLDETSEIMKKNYDELIEELRGEIENQMREVERLRAILKLFANEQNWWITDPRTAEWAGDDEEPWRIARRALEGKEP